MAADEPPYLTIGTDVSAKYKGAFCEAKVKKVNRVVKCKVTFKNNLGSFVITDDLIKGSLRVGADIEAKHPEKNQFCDAVINKLQDYSQYTVVFDDGDETTLRRTSLCLKSGRHFAESPTLDQFPLTNPEHFGTPVIGSGKFKRKRRSTLNSSLDYGSSDEDSLPRKLKAIRGKEKDPDLGKVVCVDYGDRRKKDNWYPGLVVPLPLNSTLKILKEEHLIRSFKDSKYYQVPKRDIREFTKDCGQKVENNALRTAIEKATLYLDKEELPPHWDKVLFIGLEDDETNDSETDTSDDEPSEEKDRFVAQLYKFMDERGTPINKAPTVSNRDLNLYKLFKIMHKLGGYNKVTNKNKWKSVYSKMGLPHSVANGPNQVKFAYKRYLQSFEDFYRKLGCTMVNNSRSTRGRHRSDRNIIITRTRDRTDSPKSKPIAKNTNEKKTEEKAKVTEKKDTKSEESAKAEDKPPKPPEKKKVEEEKPKREERRRSLVKKEETKPEKARTREDARKEKNDSPEKKGTRSSSKGDKKEEPKDKKVVKEKAVKEEKPKKEETVTKDRKPPVRERKTEEKSPKEKREVPPREKKDSNKEKKEPVKTKKEEVKSPEEKSPKRKLERAVKKDVAKPKVEESKEEEEKPPCVVAKEESTPKTAKLQPEEPLSSEIEKPSSLEENVILDDKKTKNESEEEPPNKGKKKQLGKSEEESVIVYSDSDDEGNRELKREIEVGDRVKVKYGRGRMQKVYEAKVLKTEADSLEKRYYVHYAGWNMRYDEWVRKNFIVAIISDNKKSEGLSKSPLPPVNVKKPERVRLPGPKSVRKNSTSSNNSSICRSMRLDKKENSEPKKQSKNLSDMSQDSDSDQEEDMEFALEVQTDFCFKEEFLSDEEEKIFDGKQDATSPVEDKILSEEKTFIEEPVEQEFKTKMEIEAENKDNALPSAEVSTPITLKEEIKEEIPPPIEDSVSNHTAVVVTPTVSETSKTPSLILPDNSESKPCNNVLNFSGLIHKPEFSMQDSDPETPELEFLPVLTSVKHDKEPELKDSSSCNLNFDSVPKTNTSDIPDENSLSKNEYPCEKIDSLPPTSVSPKPDLQAGGEDTVEKPISCLGLFATKSSDVKEESKISADDSTEAVDAEKEAEQNDFLPSFSPHPVDQPFIKLDSHIQADTVDVSKMIPGILERLKNDVITEFDTPLPPKNELAFDFLRDTSSKCMSRSDSSSSLRICESDTNDSNTGYKDMNPLLLTPLLENPTEIKSDSKTVTLNLAESDSASISKEVEKEDKMKSPEESNVDKVIDSMDIFKQITSSKDSETTTVAEENDLSETVDNDAAPDISASLTSTEVAASSQSSVADSEDTKDTLFKDQTEECNFDVKSVIKFEPANENSLANKESEKEDATTSTNSPKETSDSVSTVGFSLNNLSEKVDSSEQNSTSQSDEKTTFDPIDTLKNLASYSLKKVGKKKKLGKKLGKKLTLADKEQKMTKNKTKKKMGFSGDMKSKSKKLKKNKNKKRFKREGSCERNEEEFDKMKRKEKKKIEKRSFKCGIKNEDVIEMQIEVLKKKKGKKNRDKFLGDKKDLSEKKTKKKRKFYQDNQDTDSEKEMLTKVEKKRKKKKPKVKDCSSSDDCIDKYFKEETMDFPSTSDARQDPDMSFLLCEEKVPASPVDLLDDSSGSSSLEEGSSELHNVTNTSTVLDNTPPTTPSSTESLLSSSPSHERDYAESTQSGRESECDLFHCGPNRTISRGSDEYHAATTLAFAVCQTPAAAAVDYSKQTKTDQTPTERKKKSKRFRRMSESAKSPKHSFLRVSKVDNCYEDSSGASFAAFSNSPPYSSLSFSKSLPLRFSAEDMIYVPLHEKDPEKRIALLQKKMSELRKQYMALRAEVFAIDHKRRKARKKVKDTSGNTVNTSLHSDDGQSCS